MNIMNTQFIALLTDPRIHTAKTKLRLNEILECQLIEISCGSFHLFESASHVSILVHENQVSQAYEI